MKYEVTVYEDGFGVCSKPEHHSGMKTLYYGVFEDKEEAANVAAEKTKELYDKYDICKEWEVIRDNGPKWIRTKYETIGKWTHNFSVFVWEWTEEQWKEVEVLRRIGS